MTHEMKMSNHTLIMVRLLVDRYDNKLKFSERDLIVFHCD